MLLVVSLQGVASASSFATGTVTFLGAPTGVNDGVDYVLPYQASIDEGLGALEVNVVCFDDFDNVSLNQIWNADFFTISQAAQSGYFSNLPNALAGYEEVAWLSAQAYSDTDQQVALQHAIWDVFGSAPAEQNAQQTADLAAYQSAAAAAAANAFSGFDFSPYVFLEQVGGVVGADGTAQGLLYRTSTQLVSRGASFGATPEPATNVLLGGALVVVWFLRRRLKPANG
jgi:hypothetical protein